MSNPIEDAWQEAGEQMQQRIRKLEAELAQANAMLEWVEAAAEGVPVSDFATSFGVIRAVVDLHQTMTTMKEDYAQLYRQCKALQSQVKTLSALRAADLNRS